MKKRITIPKGYQDCDGGKCEKTQTFEVDIPDVIPVVETVPQVEIQGVGQVQQQIQVPQVPPVQAPQTPQEKVFTPEELAGLMPTGVNFAVCKGNNCADSKIQNKNLTTKFKQCPKCGCNNVPKSSSLCPCCGTDEPEDEDDKAEYWDASDIELKDDDEE